MEYVSICLCHLKFLSSVFYSFQSTDILPLWLGLFSGILLVFGGILSGINSLVYFSAASLLGYRNAINFCILILYSETFLNSCISPRSFLVESFGFSTESITSVSRERLIPPCQLGHLVFFLMSDC